MLTSFKMAARAETVVVELECNFLWVKLLF